MPGFVVQGALGSVLHCKNKLRPREKEKEKVTKSHAGRCKSHAGHHSLSQSVRSGQMFRGQGRPLCCCASGAAALPHDMTPWNTMRVIEPSPAGCQLIAMPCCQPWQRQRVGIPTPLTRTPFEDPQRLDAGLDFMRVWSSFSSSLPGSFADKVLVFTAVLALYACGLTHTRCLAMSRSCT